MLKDLKAFLWLLKLGAVVNLYFLGRTFAPDLAGAEASVLIPARILFAVSAFRCLFPVRYTDNIVFHNSILSSIFLTRALATFSEISLISLHAIVIRTLNSAQAGWVDVLAWLMVVQVVVSQVFVWGAILAQRLEFYFYEELGWAFIFAANTAASVFLYTRAGGFEGREVLLQLNLLFGVVYLPWQFFHLKSIRENARKKAGQSEPPAKVSWGTLKKGLRQSIAVKNPTSAAAAWGGLIGVSWMAAYWATLIPAWVYWIVLKI